MSATGEVVGGELDPEVALRRLSDAAQRLIPHTLVDIGWIEETGAYCSLWQIAALPEEERPGEMETIERSGLTSMQERMRLVGAGLTSRARRAGARGYLLKDVGPDE